MEDHGALLGIMTKTYLVALKEDSKAAGELKEKIKNLEKPHSYFGDLKHGNLNTSIKNAWKIWDAISEGAQKAGKDFKEQKLFADANDWLAPRR
jgi:Temperature dependent protein affecting M2 dsRNA replication